jgi:hypothetical protein
MQHTIGAMAVQECKANFKTSHHGLSWWIPALLLGRIRVEDCLATDAACGRRGKVQQQGPGSPRLNWRRAGQVHNIRVIVWIR